MRILLVIILFIHGLIHFMGFAKAFDLGNMAQFTKDISKPMGILWLLTGLVFIASAILNFTKKEAWPILAILAVLLSQLLIFAVWNDAKFGTIANAIILMVAINAYGTYRFNEKTLKETKELAGDFVEENTYVITKDDIKKLPLIVQKWMEYSGVVGKGRIVSVRLKQKGEMKTRPNGKWMPFIAEQYFDVLDPAFVWSTEVDFMPMVKMMGRDKFLNGEGEMLLKLAALFPVVDESNNEKINSAAMLRYMAEMTWFPSAALNDYINWETIDEQTAKATFTIREKSVTGVFNFSEEGKMTSFEAKRYYGAGKDATLENWFVKTAEYTEFSGFKIPAKCKVIWKLKEGDFNWLTFEITDWACNTTELFENQE